MTEAPLRIGYRVSLASRELRAILAAQLVSIAGTSIAAVALTVLVYRRTSSPLLASLVFALGFLPYLLGGGVLSGVVDRVRPRRLVTSCDALSAVLAASPACSPCCWESGRSGPSRAARAPRWPGGR
jgi:MFS family permease